MVAVAMSARLRFAAESDTGISRNLNQDYAYAGPVPGNETWTLLAVADGVGGHAHGEWASERAIELLAGSLGQALEAGDPLAALRDALLAVNRTVNVEAERNAAKGAATTLVAVLFREGQAWWANVGDSRLYLIHEGRATQVSADHSWVADQVRAGNIPPEAARHHPRKNVITRTIGFESNLLVDTGGPIPLDEGEVLVLCSDGLHGPVDDDEIARTVLSLDPEEAARQLVSAANNAGGPDNITVVIARLESEAAPPEETTVTPLKQTAEAPQLETPKRRRRWIVVGAALLLSAAAGGAAAVAYFAGVGL